jgi:hypothetical protein
MFKKVFLPLIAAVLLAVSFSGTALAAEGDGSEFIRVRGEVIAVDPDAGKFRIEKSDGDVVTFFVNEDTTFRGLDNLAEMQVGWKAGVAARDEGGRLWAVLVIAGEKPDYHRARGRVVDVNTSAGKFSIQTSSGEELRFFVDENTRYGGQISGLEDLEEGMGTGVIYKEHSEGKWIAVGVVAGHAPNLVKARGEVTAVDPQHNKFEILTAEGERMRFFVDENTRYQGQLSSLDEMQVGWQAGVAARDEKGQLTAVLVIAGIRPELVRAQGLIVGVDLAAGTFNLEKSDGSVMTFFVNERTRYHGQVADLTDLEVGMRAGVGGYVDQDGKHVARAVLAGNPPDERPEIIKAQGMIKTVNPGAEKFQLEKSDGSVLTVYVDGQTRYRGQVNGFDGLEKDMRVGFAGYVDADGKIVARLVIAGYPNRDHPRGERPAPEFDTSDGDPIQSPQA